jgi:hypothetical protein
MLQQEPIVRRVLLLGTKVHHIITSRVPKDSHHNPQNGRKSLPPTHLTRINNQNFQGGKKKKKKLPKNQWHNEEMSNELNWNFTKDKDGQKTHEEFLNMDKK